jgi:uncharacterized protein involved in type VI secretion and phage assembly
MTNAPSKLRACAATQQLLLSHFHTRVSVSRSFESEIRSISSQPLVKPENNIKPDLMKNLVQARHQNGSEFASMEKIK